MSSTSSLSSADSVDSVSNVSGLKKADLNEFFLAYDPEFNKEDLHDRVLVFDVVKNDRQVVVNAALAPRLKDNVETSCVTEEAISPSVPVKDISKLQGKAAASKREQTEYVEVFEQQAEQVIASYRKRRVEHHDDDEPQLTKNSKKCKDEHDIDLEEERKTIGESRAGKARYSENIAVEIATSDFVMSEPVIVREHRIFVHATFLAVHSEYFRALFYSGMKEATSKEVHIQVHECEEQNHLKMLEAIYRPYILDDLAIEEILQILELANKYDVTYVFRKCKYLIKTRSLTIADCEMIINCIQVKHDIPSTSDLVDTVTEFLADEFSPLDMNWEDEKFTSLSEALLRLLLNCEYSLGTQSENTVFHALMYWIVSTGYNYRSVSDERKSLLSLVTFESLTIDYLYNVVQDHHIAKYMPSFSKLYWKGITYHALPSSTRDSVLPRPPPPSEHKAYTWVITKEEIKAVQNRRSAAEEDENESNLGSNNCVVSRRFWWCGYEMQMKLCLNPPVSSSAQCLDGKLRLLVHGLKKRSRVSVKWSIACGAIKFLKRASVDQTFTCEKNTSEEAAKVRKVRRSFSNYVLPEVIFIGINIQLAD